MYLVKLVKTHSLSCDIDNNLKTNGAVDIGEISSLDYRLLGNV